MPRKKPKGNPKGYRLLTTTRLGRFKAGTVTVPGGYDALGLTGVGHEVYVVEREWADRWVEAGLLAWPGGDVPGEAPDGEAPDDTNDND